MFSCTHCGICISATGFSIPWRKSWKVSRQKPLRQSSLRTQREDCPQAAHVFYLLRPQDLRKPNSVFQRYADNTELFRKQTTPFTAWWVIRDAKASSSSWTAPRMRHYFINSPISSHLLGSSFRPFKNWKSKVIVYQIFVWVLSRCKTEQQVWMTSSPPPSPKGHLCILIPDKLDKLCCFTNSIAQVVLLRLKCSSISFFFFFFFSFFHHKFIVVVLSELTLERSKLPTSPSTTHGEPIVNGKLWLAVQA